MIISRLDIENIEDQVMRVQLYNELRKDSIDKTFDTYTTYVVKADEANRPDLISYRAYQTPELKWLVSLLAGQNDLKDDIKIGLEIVLPEKIYVRQRLQHWSSEAELENIG